MFQQEILLVERVQLFLALLPFGDLPFRVHWHLDLNVPLVALGHDVHLVKFLVVDELRVVS